MPEIRFLDVIIFPFFLFGWSKNVLLVVEQKKKKKKKINPVNLVVLPRQ